MKTRWQVVNTGLRGSKGNEYWVWDYKRMAIVKYCRYAVRAKKFSEALNICFG